MILYIIIELSIRKVIYITGDTHSDFTQSAEEKNPIQTEMTKDDYIIICGDFGGV